MPPKSLPVGNPQWLEWVEALADKADERGEKSAQAYKKAAHSLRSCPTTFTNPDEALALKGIGKGIVGHIRKKVEEEAAALGLPMPDRAPPSPVKRQEPAASKKRTAVRDEADERAAQRARSGVLAEGNFGAYDNLPQEYDELGATTTGAGKDKGKEKARGGAKPRDYIPKRNSGPYAIILALYKHADYDEPQRKATKEEIISLAQEFSTTPFDVTTGMKDGQMQQGDKTRYTAWSSMSTLQQKELVVAENKRPARYHLTDAGYALAERLIGTAGIPKHAYVPSSSSQGPPSSSGLGHDPSSSGLGRHPSSSGFGRQPSSGGVSWPPSSDAGGSSFVGRGPTLGGNRPSIHASVFRPKSPTPPLFLEEPEDREEAQFQEQLKRAMELSRRESASGAGGRNADDPVARIARQAAGRVYQGSDSARSAHSNVGASAGGVRGEGPAPRPPVAASSGLSGRRAASGLYASATSQAEAQVPTVPNVDNAFGYFYLDENDNRTKRRDEAEVSQTEDTCETLYRIEYRVAQDLHAMVRGLRQAKTLTRAKPLPGGTTKSAYIKERVSASTAPGFPESAMSGAASRPQEKEKAPSDDPFSSLLGLGGYKEQTRRSKDAMYAAPPEIRRLGAPVDPFAPVTHSLLPVASSRRGSSKSQPADQSATASGSGAVGPSQPRPSTSSVSTSTKRSLATTSSTTTSSARPIIRTTSQNPLQASFEPAPGQPLVNRHPLDPVRDLASRDDFVPPRFEPIIWKPGTFKVYLIVDTREGTREAGKRIELCEKMEQLGVLVDRKMLPLGDMIWVARRVDSTGRPTGEQDVVLDAIVERKRLDDLCSSIIDGRYVGQKIRLKDSGISHRIYLIEKYDVATHYERFGKQIWTCKSQLQVNDGFFVHESANIAETINYLKKRTQVMAEIYEPVEVRIIPDSVIDRPSYLALQQHLRATEPSRRYLTTYPIFHELNKADAALTVRSQWASMIQRLNGVSAEKAVQLLTRWDTPIRFFEEAKRWEVEVDAENRRLDAEEAAGRGPTGRAKPKRRKREDFVTNEIEDTGPRGIKGKLGGKIWDLFMTKGRYTS
ncbi:hypothetical protein JCM10212_001121 [Sporobolomyces blumeae]